MGGWFRDWTRGYIEDDVITERLINLNNTDCLSKVHGASVWSQQLAVMVHDRIQSDVVFPGTSSSGTWMLSW